MRSDLVGGTGSTCGGGEVEARSGGARSCLLGPAVNICETRALSTTFGAPPGHPVY